MVCILEVWQGSNQSFREVIVSLAGDWSLWSEATIFDETLIKFLERFSSVFSSKPNMNIKQFENKQVRVIWFKDKWYFSIVDVVEVLTESTIPKRYWADLKIKLKAEGFEAYENIVQLKLIAEDGKMRETDYADTELLLRLIQSIPSKKAEPFKLWLEA